MLGAQPACIHHSRPPSVRLWYPCRFWVKLHSLQCCGVPSPALPELLQTLELLLQVRHGRGKDRAVCHLSASCMLSAGMHLSRGAKLMHVLRPAVWTDPESIRRTVTIPTPVPLPNVLTRPSRSNLTRSSC